MRRLRRNRATDIAAAVIRPSFYAWRRTLAQRDQAIQAPGFVPVMIAPHIASSSSRITIELRGGRVVHLPETMATERVVALVRGLETSEVMP
jgi:hypothetical protein